MSTFFTLVLRRFYDDFRRFDSDFAAVLCGFDAVLAWRWYGVGAVLTLDNGTVAIRLRHGCDTLPHFLMPTNRAITPSPTRIGDVVGDVIDGAYRGVAGASMSHCRCTADTRRHTDFVRRANPFAVLSQYFCDYLYDYLYDCFYDYLCDYFYN